MVPAIRILSLSVAAALALTAPASALAQAYQCRVPASVPAARAESGEPRRMGIAGYTLALSWSPEFCRGRERSAEHRLQCSGAMGRFGFVVHGLWPEGAAGYPQYCRRVSPPPPAVFRGQLCRTPKVELIAHEWAKHGSCMARDPAGYFRVSNILADAMRYPAMESLSREGESRPGALTAGKLRAAFAAANPGRPANSFGLRLSPRGWLREVLVCLDRRFRPRRCPAAQAGPRDAAGVKIWRGL
ncbi:MAG: ribonuclease T [Novosphingobium sp.]|nr:ribonuclease T [Novosphingobium sp.]